MIKFLKGLIIGVSFTIPGVCSALTAMLLSTYDELLEIIEGFYKPRVLLKNIFLIVGIIVGICLSIVIMSFLFNSYEKYLIVYFLGLSIGGVYSLLKKNKYLDLKGLVIVGLGIIVAIAPACLNIDNKENGNLLFISIGGFISSLAFIMPGISGSMLLLTLGIYEEIINALSVSLQVLKIGIKSDSIIICIVFLVSFIIGAIVFVRIIGKILEKHEKKFIEFCIGLLIGTIVILFYVIFKSDIKIYLKFIFCILGIITIKFLG